MCQWALSGFKLFWDHLTPSPSLSHKRDNRFGTDVVMRFVSRRLAPYCVTCSCPLLSGISLDTMLVISPIFP